MRDARAHRLSFELQDSHKREEENRSRSSQQNETIFRERVAVDSKRVQFQHDITYRIRDASSRMKDDRLEETKDDRETEVEHFTRVIIDFSANRERDQHDEFSRAKLVSRRRDHEFEKHEEDTDT
jgi:hypothetical protein